MLSRTADHLYWMSRYTERAENTARMLDVNYQTSLLPQSAEVTTLLNYHVQFAGLDTFQFQVPEAVSSLAQIETVAVDATSPAIKQKTPSEPANGWVTWTVVMQREVVGMVRLSVKHDLKSAAAADAAAATEGPTSDELTVQLLRALPTPAGSGREAVPLSVIYGEAAVFKELHLDGRGERYPARHRNALRR